jgi:hypothetical protein
MHPAAAELTFARLGGVPIRVPHLPGYFDHSAENSVSIGVIAGI